MALVLAAALLIGCGSSRSLSRHSRQPDAALQQLGYGYGDAPAVAPPSQQGRQRQTPAVTPLVAELQSILADTVLGFSQVGLSVVDLTAGGVLFEHRAQQRMRPASTQKVVTAITALDHLGPAYTFATRLMATAPLEANGTLRGDLYLRGAMDPLLSAADVRRLAAALRQAGVREVRGRLIVDASLKDADEWGWGWCWDDDNPTLTPLLVGGKPQLAVAMQNALRGAGVRVTVPAAGSGTTPAGARELAAVRRPLTEVLQPMMKESDNLCAESVFYQLGPTRDKAAAAIKETLAAAAGAAAGGGAGEGAGGGAGAAGGGAWDGCDTAAYSTGAAGRDLARIVVADGSGLSLYNYHTAASFTRLLAYAAARPDSILNPLLAFLPIAATDGTLSRRMAGTAAAGRVRAKTGSVTAVSSLVGYTTQRSTGHLIAFAIINNGVQTMAQGRALQDRICIALSQ